MGGSGVVRPGAVGDLASAPPTSQNSRLRHAPGRYTPSWRRNPDPLEAPSEPGDRDPVDAAGDQPAGDARLVHVGDSPGFELPPHHRGSRPDVDISVLRIPLGAVPAIALAPFPWPRSGRPVLPGGHGAALTEIRRPVVRVVRRRAAASGVEQQRQASSSSVGRRGQQRQASGSSVGAGQRQASSSSVRRRASISSCYPSNQQTKREGSGRSAMTLLLEERLHSPLFGASSTHTIVSNPSALAPPMAFGPARRRAAASGSSCHQ
jgi:hypothetical protein